MRWRLLRHEWHALAADASLWLVFGVFAAAIAYGTYTGVRWVSFQESAVAEAQREEQERIGRHEAEIARIARERATVPAFADPRNPDAVGRGLGARYAVLPPAPLAALAIGQSDLLPYYFRMSTDAKETVLAASELENPHRLLAGRFDLAFVLVYLYPLLILALMYNVLSAEREQGTLALALSQPISVRRLVAAKVAARGLLFFVAIVPVVWLALVVVRVDITAPGAAPRLLLWTGAVIAYGLFWFAAAACVASLARSSATNAMLLAALWLVLVVLVPSMLNMTVTALYPVPSRVDMIQAMRVASDEANAEGSKLLAQYYEDHPELASGDAVQAAINVSLVRVAVATAVERRVRPVLDRYTRQIESQQVLVARARVLSPAILMQDALAEVAGTGIARHRSFMAQVEEYHAAWRGYFVPLIFARAQLQNFDAIPRFTFVDEAVAPVARRVATALGALLMPMLALAAFAFVRLRRYPAV